MNGKTCKAKLIKEILDIYHNSTDEEKKIILAFFDTIAAGKTLEEAIEQANSVRVSFGKKPVHIPPGLIC